MSCRLYVCVGNLMSKQVKSGLCTLFPTVAIFAVTLSAGGAEEELRIEAALKKSTTPGITRSIDASQYFRHFPRLPAGRNTSIQKAPTPVLAQRSEREFGKARITKCWLNLDEMWDYRTRHYDFNYQIGVHKYDA